MSEQGDDELPLSPDIPEAANMAQAAEMQHVADAVQAVEVQELANILDEFSDNEDDDPTTDEPPQAHMPNLKIKFRDLDTTATSLLALNRNKIKERLWLLQQQQDSVADQLNALQITKELIGDNNAPLLQSVDARIESVTSKQNEIHTNVQQLQNQIKVISRNKTLIAGKLPMPRLAPDDGESMLDFEALHFAVPTMSDSDSTVNFTELWHKLAHFATTRGLNETDLKTALSSLLKENVYKQYLKIKDRPIAFIAKSLNSQFGSSTQMTDRLAELDQAEKREDETLAGYMQRVLCLIEETQVCFPTRDQHTRKSMTMEQKLMEALSPTCKQQVDMAKHQALKEGIPLQYKQIYSIANEFTNTERTKNKHSLHATSHLKSNERSTSRESRISSLQDARRRARSSSFESRRNISSSPTPSYSTNTNSPKDHRSRESVKPKSHAFDRNNRNPNASRRDQKFRDPRQRSQSAERFPRHFKHKNRDTTYRDQRRDVPFQKQHNNYQGYSGNNDYDRKQVHFAPKPLNSNSEKYTVQTFVIDGRGKVCRYCVQKYSEIHLTRNCHRREERKRFYGDNNQNRRSNN